MENVNSHSNDDPSFPDAFEVREFQKEFWAAATDEVQTTEQLIIIFYCAKKKKKPKEIAREMRHELGMTAMEIENEILHICERAGKKLKSRYGEEAFRDVVKHQDIFFKSLGL